MNTCPGGTGSESCCTSLEVIGGTFSRTYTNPGDGGIDEQDPASVTGFRLDKYEVTVGRFRQFANAVLPPDGGTGWLPPAASGKHTHLNGGQGLANSGSPGNYESGWVTSDNAQVTLLGCVGNAYATWTPSAGSNENLPINCVNSYEAYAFCIWDGGFLPSEAEWEYAAAGGSLELEFPWGSADPGTTSQYAIYGCDYNGSGTCTGVANIAPVGTTTLGAGVWGQLDLAGNLMEWDLDWYAAYTTCTDCAYLETGTNRMVRGGAYPYPSSYFPLRNYTTAATYRGSDVGFRCARIP